MPTLIPFFGTYGIQNQFSQTTEAGAGFAQVDYDILSNLTVTGGIRYSKEKKTLLISDDFATPTYTNFERATASRVTWKAALNWKFVPDWLVYASVSTGFKSPAFNTTLSVDGGSKPAAPEKSTNYEIGIKGQTADRKLQISSAIFHTEYRDFQVVTIPDNAVVSTTVLLNADGAKIWGAELEVNARPVSGLTLNASATYLDTKIESPGLLIGNIPLDGKRLTRSPRWALKWFGTYEFDTAGAGRFGVRVDGSYQSAMESQLNNGPASHIRPYALVNAGVNWSPDGNRYRLELFVDNVFNKAYTTYQYILSDVNALQWGRPRTWGIRASAHW